MSIRDHVRKLRPVRDLTNLVDKKIQDHFIRVKFNLNPKSEGEFNKLHIN